MVQIFTSRMCSMGKYGLWRTVTNILKAIFMVFIMKVILGFFDVGSDVINGTIMVSGEYKLGLYFASGTREDYDLLPDPTVWGYQTLCLPWLPGLLRIIFLASDVQWGSLKWTEKFGKIAGYLLSFISWPLFSVLM